MEIANGEHIVCSEYYNGYIYVATSRNIIYRTHKTDMVYWEVIVEENPTQITKYISSCICNNVIVFLSSDINNAFYTHLIVIKVATDNTFEIFNTFGADNNAMNGKVFNEVVSYNDGIFLCGNNNKILFIKNPSVIFFSSGGTVNFENLILGLTNQYDLMSATYHPDRNEIIVLTASDAIDSTLNIFTFSIDNNHNVAYSYEYNIFSLVDNTKSYKIRYNPEYHIGVLLVGISSSTNPNNTHYIYDLITETINAQFTDVLYNNTTDYRYDPVTETFVFFGRNGYYGLGARLSNVSVFQ
jgi:hypothetical protein